MIYYDTLTGRQYWPLQSKILRTPLPPPPGNGHHSLCRNTFLPVRHVRLQLIRGCCCRCVPRPHCHHQRYYGLTLKRGTARPTTAPYCSARQQRMSMSNKSQAGVQASRPPEVLPSPSYPRKDAFFATRLHARAGTAALLAAQRS